MKAMAPFMLASLLLCNGLASSAARSQSHQEFVPMHALGTFDVKVLPQTPDNPPARASGVGRLSLDKAFHGDLRGSGHGEMLAAGDGSVSGAYVAIEKITGTLHGRSGSFFMVHRALMVQGTPQEWTVVVVPESGTDALKGLSGSMKIVIAGGKHSYDFSYTLE